MFSSIRAGFTHQRTIALGGALSAAGLASIWLVPNAAADKAPEAPPSALNPNDWKAFKLQSIDTGGPPNTNRYRFALENPKQEVGLPVASCLVTRAAIGSENDDGSKKFVIRPYTPTSPKDAKGYFDLVVKVYEQGKMSKHFGELKEGDEVEMKGPLVKFQYKANMKKKIGMIAGGSGITPMLQVASEIVSNPDDKTQVSLVFANQTEKDIILKKELDEMAAKHNNFQVYYTIDDIGEGVGKEWKGGVGYVTREMATDHMPPPSDDNLVLICGPPPMYKALSGEKKSPKDQGELSGILKAMGYTEQQVFKF
ncbi:hypothetical protein ABBQ32_011029 [Trebouxia sp. C0010 RCD-2024]